MTFNNFCSEILFVHTRSRKDNDVKYIIQSFMLQGQSINFQAPYEINIHYNQFILTNKLKADYICNLKIWLTIFDLIGARSAYVNLFSTTSAKRSSSGR